MAWLELGREEEGVGESDKSTTTTTTTGSREAVNSRVRKFVRSNFETSKFLVLESIDA